MRGRWAAGIIPRNFCWILKDQLAVSERPGGFAPHHRRVRRQEEIFWLNAQGFTRIVSLLPSNHNLHAYDELHIVGSHFALPTHGDPRPVLAELYRSMWQWLCDNERILVHQEELSEQVAGVAAGFLCWSGLLAEPPRAVSAVEQLTRRQMGAAGRTIVAAASELAPAQGLAHRRDVLGGPRLQRIDATAASGGPPVTSRIGAAAATSAKPSTKPVVAARAHGSPSPPARHPKDDAAPPVKSPTPKRAVASTKSAADAGSAASDALAPAGAAQPAKASPRSKETATNATAEGGAAAVSGKGHAKQDSPT